jgi:hypothetical protein
MNDGCVGYLYCCDRDNNRVRKVTPKGEVSTFVGNGTPTWREGEGSKAGTDQPHDIVCTRTGEFVMIDRSSLSLITPDGNIPSSSHPFLFR